MLCRILRSPLRSQWKREVWRHKTWFNPPFRLKCLYQVRTIATHQFSDVAEIHARLLDHKPVLQGHISYFLHEFEEKRKNREEDRLNKVLENVTEMNENLIPESLDAMQVFLTDIAGKVKVATEMCRKIEDGEIFENKEILENRKIRKQRWDDFIQGQYQNCDEIDRDFQEQVDRLKTHYDELEDKLGYSSRNAP